MKWSEIKYNIGLCLSKTTNIIYKLENYTLESLYSYNETKLYYLLKSADPCLA